MDAGNGKATAVGTAENTATFVDLYRTMKLIRRVEEVTQSLFLRGEIYGSTHLCIGQEAVSAGVCPMVEPRDRVAATYRGHGHILALGCDPQGLLEELMGRRGGLCGGRSGSMNVVDLSKSLLGCFGIVGGSIAAATGAGLGLRRRGEGGVAVAFFGDGAANQAYFHECLNFAKVFRLPVVYVCENNQYGEYTPMDQVTPGGIVGRVAALDIPASTVDGNDVWAMREAASEALARVRADEGPIFLEASTYRFSDHGRGDPVDYRRPGEMERWRERDPLTLARQRLTGEFEVPVEDLDIIDNDVDDQVSRLREAALATPFPEPEPASQFK